MRLFFPPRKARNHAVSEKEPLRTRNVINFEAKHSSRTSTTWNMRRIIAMALAPEVTSTSLLNGLLPLPSAINLIIFIDDRFVVLISHFANRIFSFSSSCWCRVWGVSLAMMRVPWHPSTAISSKAKVDLIGRVYQFFVWINSTQVEPFLLHFWILFNEMLPSWGAFSLHQTIITSSQNVVSRAFSTNWTWMLSWEASTHPHSLQNPNLHNSFNFNELSPTFLHQQKKT